VGYLNLRGTVAVRLSNKSRFSALYLWERHSPTLLWVLSSGNDVNGCEAAADLAGDVALEDTEQHTGTCTKGRSCPSAVDNSVTRRSNGRSEIEVSRDVFWTGLEIVRLRYSGPWKAPGQSARNDLRIGIGFRFGFSIAYGFGCSRHSVWWRRAISR
jgi:hypothetical protein